ncbi:MAG TPA: hypothetical protein VEW71_04770 [Allosphingosinicella sp.]|nr:hypothetical protein [Allosphingosinicella sp.]
MRLFGIFLLTACLGGCGGAVEPGSFPHQQGRYAGIGIYGAGDMWQRLVAASRPQYAVAATLRDDEVVIVVVDSRTGEVRQCGNLTGYCIGSNPWAGPLGREQALPVSVTEHLADVERARNRQNEAAAAELDTAVNAATNESQPARR